MNHEHDRLRAKVTRLLTAAPRASVKRGQTEPHLTPAREALRKALRRQYGNESAKNLAFHLIDWTYDAAFLLAVGMFSKRFTLRELRYGAEMVLVHVPNHIAAAAKISENTCEDIWGETPFSKMKKRKRPTKPRTVFPTRPARAGKRRRLALPKTESKAR
ncbi:MAG: hypothetical protein NTV22_19175 [bacterium]|nr:hypothetical protein [bacterium]